MKSLYELNHDFDQVLNMLYDPDIDEQMVFDTLESIEYDIEEKAENCAKIIKILEGESKTIKEEESRLKSRKKAMENRVDWLKTNLEMTMKNTGKTKFKTALFSFNIQKNPQSVEILDEEKAMASKFIKIKKEIDKTAIKEAIQAGEQIDFARIIQTEGVRIR